LIYTGRLLSSVPFGSVVRSTQRTPSLATSTPGGRGPIAPVQSTFSSARAAAGGRARSPKRPPSLATAAAGGRGPFAAVQSTFASGGADTPSPANTLSVPIAFAVTSALGSAVSITYVLPGSTVIANHRVSGYAVNVCDSDVPLGTRTRVVAVVHEGNLKDPIRVCQLPASPFAWLL